MRSNSLHKLMSKWWHIEKGLYLKCYVRAIHCQLQHEKKKDVVGNVALFRYKKKSIQLQHLENTKMLPANISTHRYKLTPAENTDAMCKAFCTFYIIWQLYNIVSHPVTYTEKLH